MTSDATAPANDAAMAGFGPIARTWFTDVFAAPTPVQIAAWQAIGSGNNALVIAPTGSGKTLAAFLQSLDRLASRATQPALIGASEGAAPTQEPAAHVKGVRVLYISPLKALAVDIERNLQAPARHDGDCGATWATRTAGQRCGALRRHHGSTAPTHRHPSP